MWGVWWDEFPLASFCCQEVLDGCHLRCGLQYLVGGMKFISSSLEVGTIVRMNGPWSPSTCDGASQGSKKCFSSQTSDYFNMDCLGGKVNKCSNVTLNYDFATGFSDPEGNWSRIIHSCVEEWSGWLDSCWWKLTHELLGGLYHWFITNQAMMDDCLHQVSDPWDPILLM